MISALLPTFFLQAISSSLEQGNSHSGINAENMADKRAIRSPFIKFYHCFYARVLTCIVLVERTFFMAKCHRSSLKLALNQPINWNRICHRLIFFSKVGNRCDLYNVHPLKPSPRLCCLTDLLWPS